MKKNILTICLVILLNACANQPLNIYGMPKAPKTGPAEYIQGWHAGCETGMTAYSTDYLRSTYRTNVDGYMMQNKYYAKGWELGQSYCSYYVSTYLSNKNEFTDKDLRSGNTWFSMKSDGFFSYKNMDSLDWMPFATAEYSE